MRQSSLTMRALVLLGTLSIVACSSATELGGNNANGIGGHKKGKSHLETDDGTTQAKSPDDPERPSDSSEGLSGYLVDPDMVSIAVSGSPAQLQVNGAAGAIAATDLSKVVVSVWSVKDADLTSGTAGVDGSTAVKGKHLGDLTPSATDGSFAGSFPIDADGERYAISLRGNAVAGNFGVGAALDGRYTAMSWAPGEGDHPIPLAAAGGGVAASEMAPSESGSTIIIDGNKTVTSGSAGIGPAAFEGRKGTPYPAWSASTLLVQNVRIDNLADGATVPAGQTVSVHVEADPDAQFTSFRLVVTDERPYTQWVPVTNTGVAGASFTPLGAAGETRTLEVAVYDQLMLPVGRSAPITIHIAPP
jgi:hypothetical protein